MLYYICSIINILQHFFRIWDIYKKQSLIFHWSSKRNNCPATFLPIFRSCTFNKLYRWSESCFSDVSSIYIVFNSPWTSYHQSRNYANLYSRYTLSYSIYFKAIFSMAGREENQENKRQLYKKFRGERIRDRITIIDLLHEVFNSRIVSDSGEWVKQICFLVV